MERPVIPGRRRIPSWAVELRARSDLLMTNPGLDCRLAIHTASCIADERCDDETRVTAKGIISVDDRVLLARQPDGAWDLPEGRLNPGETPPAGSFVSRPHPRHEAIACNETYLPHPLMSTFSRYGCRFSSRAFFFQLGRRLCSKIPPIFPYSTGNSTGQFASIRTPPRDHQLGRRYG